jgi:oligosaccharyltransferase complex subunit alpha (ribophorin I)
LKDVSCPGPKKTSLQRLSISTTRLFLVLISLGRIVDEPFEPRFDNMKPLAIATAVLSFATTALCVDKSNLTKPLTSKNVLPSTFKPPQVFKNINLVHVINLEKSYPKESINVVIENIASTPQDEYFIPFTDEQMEKIGGLEVRDRKVPELGMFIVEPVEIEAER